MTKFEELCSIYTEAEQDFSNYRWKCIDLAVELGNKLADYMECGKEEIQYYLTSNLTQPQGANLPNQPKEAHPRDALILENDTYWHYGMGVNLYQGTNKNPAMTYILDVALKGQKDNFIINFPKQQKQFNINPNKQKDFQNISEFIYNEIKGRFENELEKFLKHQSTEHYPGYR